MDHKEAVKEEENFSDELRKAVDETVDKIFARFDKNLNGVLDVQELSAFAKAALQEMNV